MNTYIMPSVPCRKAIFGFGLQGCVAAVV